MHKADFERLLATRSRGRSAHFAVHHVNAMPACPARGRAGRAVKDLSTTCAEDGSQSVDKVPGEHWLGCMVPKRQAKRSVTRSLLKRQMRETFQRHAAQLPHGLWLLRLHAGFPVRDYPAAQSQALADVARRELDALLSKAAVAQPAAPSTAVARA